MEHENADVQAKEFLMSSDRQGRAVDYGVYAKMMRKSFERVREFRMEKFKFSDICRGYAKAGALPTDADPSSFRKAFRNEEKRRAKNLELEKRISDGRNAPAGHDVAAGKVPAKNPAALSVPAKSEQERTDAERERIKRLISSKNNMGNGKTVKNPDGSFDFD